MNKTTFINFSSLDYNGVDSLSTYATSLTPLKFIPEIPKNFPHRLAWDFGDGTTSKSVSSTKIYNFPGVYNVSLIVYDCDTNANISTYTKNIIVEDYIKFTFNIKFDIEDVEYLLTEDGYFILDEFDNYVSIDSNDITLKCGEISKPFTLNSYYPIYQPQSSIYYTITDSNSKNYWDIQNNKFSHLENYHALYSKIYNYSIKKYQYNPIDKIDSQPVERYIKISNGSLIDCEKTDIGSLLVGYSSSQIFYIKDDALVNAATINFKFDKNKNVINPSSKKQIPYLNNLGIDLRYSVIDNDNIDYLSITSNGLDGEGASVSSFNISPIKFFDTKIPFVVKIKDSNLFSVKNFDSISLSSININISGSYVTETYPIWYNGDDVVYNGDEFQYTTSYSTILSSDYVIYSLNDTLSSQNSGGCFRGYIQFPQLSSEKLENVTISVGGTFINDQLLVYNLSGISSGFDVYKKNYYDIFKKNEDFNPEETIKNLRFQETLLDKDVLFEDFLGGILGNSTSDHEAIGVKIYEKISNFTVNTQDVDYCELEFLDSLGDYVDYNDVGEERYMYPEKIKRLVNLGSIDKFKLAGIPNKFKENLDIKGRTSKEVYGVNIGDKINVLTYTVNINTPIVALEKFSNQYILLNTYQPYFTEYINLLTENSEFLSNENGENLQILNTQFASLSNYPLSTYNSEWGWPLVLPNDFNFSDIEKYYLFFEYNDGYDNTPIGGIIDFDNTKTTISNEDLNLETFKHMNMDVLYQTLKLLD